MSSPVQITTPVNGALCVSLAAAATPWVTHVNEWLQIVAALVAIASGAIAAYHYIKVIRKK